jgi:cytochrome c6
MTKSMPKVAILTVAVLFGGALALAAAPAAENWENTCASCHGVDGKGDTRQGKRLKLKDYTDKSSLADFTDEQLFQIVSEGVVVDGKQRKKGYKDEFSADEIKALIQYVRSFAK